MSQISLFRNWKFYTAVLLLCLIASASVLAYRFMLKKGNQPDLPAEPSKQIAKPSPEDVSLLLESMSAPPQLTPEQIEEDARMDAEQVAHAREWLESADPQQRITGAEQLSAYPTAEAEHLLAGALSNDSEPEVRSAAARSLEYIKAPDAKTLDALQHALQNDNEDVAFDAVNTLTAYAGREPFGSERAADIIKRLKQAANSGQLQGKAQITVQNFLNDQTAGEGK